MRKWYFFICFMTLGFFFTGCNENGDKEKVVVMTIYPETGYGSNVLSDIITQPLVFSDSDDDRKQMLMDIITEGFDFEYKRGYEYTLKVKKVRMDNPPQDVSSIKYIFLELLSQEKVITQDSESTTEFFVSSQTVKFLPSYGAAPQSEVPKIYNALYVKEKETGNWMALIAIEGFDYEEGYEYTLSVKRVLQAEPYSVKYVLLDVLSKKKKE